MGKFGITTENIQDRYQCRLEAIRPAQIVELRKIYTSLRDGMSKPSDWFAIQEVKKSDAQDLNAMVDGAAAVEVKPEHTEEPTPPAPTIDTTKPTPTEEQFAALVEAVSTGVKEVAEVLEEYALTDEQKAEINAL